MSKAGERLIEAANEAVAVARGDQHAAKTTHYDVRWRSIGKTAEGDGMRIGFDTGQGQIDLVMSMEQFIWLQSAMLGTTFEMALPGVVRTIPPP